MIYQLAAAALAGESNMPVYIIIFNHSSMFNPATKTNVLKSSSNSIFFNAYTSAESGAQTFIQGASIYGIILELDYLQIHIHAFMYYPVFRMCYIHDI